MELEGKRYIVRGKRKILAEYAFKADAEQKFKKLCKKHWKRSFYIVDSLTGKCIEDRHVFTNELTDEEKQKILKEFDDAVNEHLEIIQKYAAACDEEY